MPDDTKTPPLCCFLAIKKNPATGCGALATWQIATGDTPDDYTLACAQHVGALCDPARHNVVTKFSG